MNFLKLRKQIFLSGRTVEKTKPVLVSKICEYSYDFLKDVASEMGYVVPRGLSYIYLQQDDLVNSQYSGLVSQCKKKINEYQKMYTR